MVSGTIIESVKDAIAVGLTIVESAEKEMVWILSPAMLVFPFQFDVSKKSKILIEKCERVRECRKKEPTAMSCANA